MARKRTMTAAIAVIATISILLAMLLGCESTTVEERFEDCRSNAAVATTAGAAILKLKAIYVLEDTGDIVVEDSYISAAFVDNIPQITFVALVTEEGKETELRKYSVQTDYNGPIVSCFNSNSEKISMYGEMLYVEEYFENAGYSLQGEEIVVTE